MQDLHSDVLVVYFDTSFWVRLREASEEAALTAIAELNELNVRYAISRLHIIELIAYRGEGLDLISDRAKHFKLSPLLVDDDCDLEALRAPLSEREPWVQELDEVSYAYAEASAMAISARRMSAPHAEQSELENAPNDDEQELARRERDREIQEEAFRRLRSAGLLDTEGNLHLGKMLAKAGFEGLEKHGTVNLLAPPQPTSERRRQLQDLSAAVLAAIPPSELVRAEERHQLEDAAFRNDTRPHELVVGRATPADARQVRNTGRDIEHIETFIANADRIDFFQLDKEQNVLLRTTPSHPLRLRNLEGRCFAAAGLTQTTNRIRKMRNTKLPILRKSPQPPRPRPPPSTLSTVAIEALSQRIEATSEFAQEGTHICTDSVAQFGTELATLTSQLHDCKTRIESGEPPELADITELSGQLGAALRAFARQLTAGREQARFGFTRLFALQRQILHAAQTAGIDFTPILQPLKTLEMSAHMARERLATLTDQLSKLPPFSLPVSIAKDAALASLTAHDAFLTDVTTELQAICNL